MPINTRTFSDINMNFTPNPITQDILKVTGPNSIVQSVMNLVQLSHYDKPFHPEIGSNIRKILFEPLDAISADALSTEITNLLGNFEPRVKTKTVAVQSNSNLDGYDVTIEFYLLNVTTPLTIGVFLQRLR